MLVALTVLGFLMIALNQGVRTGLGIWNAQARRLGDVGEIVATARVLRTLLADIPVAPSVNTDRGLPFALAFNGTADHLEFVGDLPNGMGLTRRAVITFALRDDRLVVNWMPRRRELAATPQPSSVAELLRGVSRLQFAYFRASVPGSPSGWVSKWEGPVLPALIRVQLSFAKGDARHWPDLIVAPRLAAPGE